ncbi:MAG TPA: 3-methyl-2-oxobutanoate hydroxymethyltransferase [Actinomycetota bacterium]|nr:3-methyl-2-oxobutanoate hydroxymethyltransferase [Actinomycetota bacterium]
MPTTVRDLARYKSDGRRFAMLTAYDFPTARLLDEAGIPALLVGDSLGQVVLGYDTTLPVTMDEMLHHCRAVARGARTALLIGDMPFGSYQTSLEDGIRNATRMLKEGGMHAVKFEGWMPELTQALTERGIPVMAHLGLTPQSVHAFGGYRVQAKNEEDAHALVAHALDLQKAGAFALVLEAVPAAVAASVTQALAIPTIGVGAGPGCDGQVLVVHDLLGFRAGVEATRSPKFVKAQADLATVIHDAARAYLHEVEAGTFPDEAHSY